MTQPPKDALPAPRSFLIHGDVGFCNAVRRTLLSDLETEAPCSVRFARNVTCYTDEFLAHRVGLIPFRRTGNGSTMSLSAEGPCTVLASQLVGPAFESVHGNIAILTLGPTHSIEMEIAFDRRRAGAHARYSPCAAVAMQRVSPEVHRLTFSSNDTRSPETLLAEALDALERRVDRALLHLASDAPLLPSFI